VKRPDHRFAPGVIVGTRRPRSKRNGALVLCLTVALICATFAWPLLEAWLL
jgi:hypothetical protein